jgi:plasmid stabilization system protein ParE
MRLVVAPDAEADFDEIIRTGAQAFGEAAAHRYRLLIQQAYADVLVRPDRPASPGVPDPLRLYPIRRSRLGVVAPDRVGQPRHVLVYRYDAMRLEIVRILHDRMDIPARLTEPGESSSG